MGIVKNTESKIYREAKYLYRDVNYALGIYNNFYKKACGNRIMIYHGICLQDHKRFNPIFLTRDIFESHLKFYKKYFNVISLADYYQQKFSRKKFNVCLTFDDGFANNYNYVLPLLERYKIPATFFITAIRDSGYDILWNDFLGIVSKYGPKKIIYKDEPYYKGKYDKYISVKTGISLVEHLRCCNFNEKAALMDFLYPLVPFKLNKVDEDYWLQMTCEQIKQMAESQFVNIGAHGHYHNDLSKIPIGSARTELAFSKQYLENIINKPVDSFAFPYGSYTPDVINHAKAIGYTQLLAMDFLYATDHQDVTMRERFTVNPFISTNNQMHATIKRHYDH